MLDKTKTSSEQDFNSQIDYLIKKGIFNKPSDVKTISDIETDSFKSLSSTEQKNLISKYTDEWWKQYGFEQMNELYSDTIIKTEDFRGDITDFWIKYLENEKDELEKYLGIEEYREKINKPLDLDIPDNPFDETDSDDEIYTDDDDEVNEWEIKLGNHLKLNNFQLKNDEVEQIKQSLQQRRKNGGCSVWKKIGIKWMIDNRFYDELLDWEQQYFLDGITKGYWDSEGNHIGDNSNPYVKKKRITES